MSVTIDDLLKALSPAPGQGGNKLENSKITWSRIGAKDQFLELGLEETEKDAFLKEWTEENPYSNI